MCASAHATEKVFMGIIFLLLLSVFVGQASPRQPNLAVGWDEIRSLEQMATYGVVVDEVLAEHGIYDASAVGSVISAITELTSGERDIEGIDPDSTKFLITMRAPCLKTGSSQLHDVWPKDYDLFIFLLFGPGTWNMEIQDPMIYPDDVVLMGFGRIAGEKVSGKAEPPDIAYLGPVEVGDAFDIGFVIVCYFGRPGRYNYQASYD